MLAAATAFWFWRTRRCLTLGLTKVKGIFNHLLKDLNLKTDEVPLLAGELVNADQKGACASMNRIIADLPKTIPTAHVVSSQGCIGRPDRLHFTPAGYRELGRRYAEKMLLLLGYNAAEPTTRDTRPTTQPKTFIN